MKDKVQTLQDFGEVLHVENPERTDPSRHVILPLLAIS